MLAGECNPGPETMTMTDKDLRCEDGILCAERSLLLLIDVQLRLAPSIDGHEGIVARCQALAESARDLGVPVLATEHCPEALGETLPLLRETVTASQVVGKRYFSGMDEAALPEALGRSGRSQIIVAGMEAHVCVLQSALGLMAEGYDCRVVADAVGSRHPEDRRIGLDRLRQAGVGVVTTEMVLFEWLRHVDHPAFRTVIGRIKRLS
jgi:nicotinamidase-related amidase